MALLPPDGAWTVELIEGQVYVYRRRGGEEEEIVRFDAADGKKAAEAQKVILANEVLTVEQRAFAHFWSWYFYACACIETRR